MTVTSKTDKRHVVSNLETVSVGYFFPSEGGMMSMNKFFSIFPIELCVQMLQFRAIPVIIQSQIVGEQQITVRLLLDINSVHGNGMPTPI